MCMIVDAQFWFSDGSQLLVLRRGYLKRIIHIHATFNFYGIVPELTMIWAFGRRLNDGRDEADRFGCVLLAGVHRLLYD